MAAGYRFYFGGTQSFYQSGILPENDAAHFARPAFPDLFERFFSNLAGHTAFDSKIYAPGCLGNNRAFNRGLSGEYLYGDECEFVSRI